MRSSFIAMAGAIALMNSGPIHSDAFYDPQPFKNNDPHLGSKSRNRQFRIGISKTAHKRKAQHKARMKARKS